MRCQDCKKHTNKPSFCKEKKKFVPRKKADCKDFINK